MNIFVTGTDTDVGKTVTSAWICRNTEALYWKPIQTGDYSDSGVVLHFSPHTHIVPNVYHLKVPLSAYDAAQIEGISIDVGKIVEQCPQSNTVIEGAGGALVPITENVTMVDLVARLNAKALVVAKSQLGFLNHIFLTIEALRARNVSILGVVLNGETELIHTIEKFAKCKVLAVLKNLDATSNVEVPVEILQELR